MPTRADNPATAASPLPAAPAERPWFQYLGATAFVLFALTAQYYIDGPTATHTGFECATLAVLGAAGLFRYGPSLYAALLSAIGQIVLVLDPAWHVDTIASSDVVALLLFIGIALLMCRLIERLKQTRATNERQIGELIASDQARLLSETRLDAGLTAIGDPMFILRPIRGPGLSGLSAAGPIEDFVVEYENHHAAALHEGGFASRDAHLGRRLSDIGPVHRNAGLHDLYERAFLGDAPAEREIRLDRRNLAGAVVGELAAHESFDADGERHLEVRARRLGDSVVVQWRDVTARRRAESSRALSEGRYRTLVQAFGAIVWQADRGGGLTGDLSSWTRFTGQTAEQAAGPGWLAAIPPEDRPRVEKLWRDGVASGRPFEFERRVRRADGTDRYMVARAAPIHASDDPSRIAEFLGVDTDVTERKEAEAIIADNERQLRRVLNALFSFVFVARPDGTLIGVNEQALRTADRSLGELVGRHFWELDFWAGSPGEAGSPGGADRVRRMIARAAAGEVVREDVPMRLDDSRTLIVDLMVAPMRDETGTITHLIPSAVDVSERHRARTELAEREARFRRLYESNLIGVAFYDASRRRAEANAAMRTILGLADATGEIDWPPATPAAWGEIDFVEQRRLNLEGRSGPFEKEILRPDGRRVPVMVAAAVLHDQHPETGVAFVVNMTRVKRVEEALRRTEANLRAMNESLEQRIRERTAEVQQRSDQLRALALQMTEAESRERKRLAQVLHDHFQQLASAAKLKVGLIRRRIEPESPLHETIVQAEGLLAETIDASRSLATELSPPVLHDAGLESALEWLARKMERESQLAVALDVEPGSEPENEQVRTILFECAKELLRNVVEHSGTRAATLHVGTVGEGLLQLSVGDAGKGFDANEVEFKPKADGSFGLFSIKERLALLGGVVRVKSHPGHGTQVTVSVPTRFRTSAGRPGGARDADEIGPGGNASGERLPTTRVLVADDHKLFREGLISLITQEPFVDVVGQANDGEEAVELARSLRPDVLICDITMPKLNGVQVTARLHAEMPRLKIIGLSMHERDDMARAMRDAGAVAYCTKGGPTETLLGVLRNVADSRAPAATKPPAAASDEGNETDSPDDSSVGSRLA